jgi:hypothetical protein
MLSPATARGPGKKKQQNKKMVIFVSVWVL